MSTVTVDPGHSQQPMPPAPQGQPAAPSYLDDGHTLASWFVTRDHKRIAILYAIAITMFFAIGGIAAAMIRIELATPAGDFVSDDTYAKLFTAHGVIMVWLFLIPSIPSAFGNFLVPLMIGARDLAFPRLNLTSWYLYVIGGAIVLASLFLGGLDTGWTFYTPYSTMFSNGWVVVALVGVVVVGFSSILTGLNFIVTVHKLRAPGLTWFRLPIFVWTLYATALVMVLATPVLAASLILIVFSYIFLSLALKTLPLGTAYAIWTGIGAAGTAVAGILLFRESGEWSRLFFIGVILAGIIGLKWVERDPGKEARTRQVSADTAGSGLRR